MYLRYLFLAASFVGAGCELPREGPHLVVWRIMEGNKNNTLINADSDNPETRPPSLLNCSHPYAVTKTIRFTLEDNDNASRHMTENYDCAEGELAVTELDIPEQEGEHPIAGIELTLRDGSYSLTVQGSTRDQRVATTAESGTEFTVEASGADAHTHEDREGVVWKVHLLTLRQQTTPFSIEVVGTESCEEVSMSIEYASPDMIIPFGDGERTPYRQMLCPHGLALDALQSRSCGAWVGSHLFEDVDYGRYTLRAATQDGRMCEVDFEHLPADEPNEVQLDLRACQRDRR